ncbi:MAG: hypothetical protein EBV92_11795, partial [Betaproteobacteria bacterium]|nr:hypothetical protein [Betaproteobacteria bacterium]
ASHWPLSSEKLTSCMRRRRPRDRLIPAPLKTLVSELVDALNPCPQVLLLRSKGCLQAYCCFHGL